MKYTNVNDLYAHEVDAIMSEALANKPEMKALIEKIQKDLQRMGIAWHDPINNACCSDGGCCDETVGNYNLRFPINDHVSLKRVLDDTAKGLHVFVEALSKAADQTPDQDLQEEHPCPTQAMSYD